MRGIGMGKQSKAIQDLSKVSIESERLVLKPISRNYGRDIFAGFDEQVTRFLVHEPNESLEQVDDFLAKSIQSAKDGTDLDLAITTKDGEFLGIGSLHHVDSREPEIGLWLKTAAQGRGFGSELAFAIAEWAVDNLDLDHLQYRADAKNVRSWKIAEKLVQKYGGRFAGEEIEILGGKERTTRFYQITPTKTS